MATLRDDGLVTPHPSRLDPDAPHYEACMAAHAAAAARGDEFYIDPLSGLVVMTATNLAQRPCCNSRCRHCPWVDS